MRPLRFRLTALGILAAFDCLLTAPLAAQTVTELYVTPDTLRLEAGKREGITAQAFDDAGNAILAIRYRVTDSTVARVANNGTVTGVRRGRTRLTVTAGRKSRTILVLVAGDAAPPPTPRAPEVTAAVDVAQLVPETTSLTLLPTESARIPVRALRPDGSVAGPIRLIWRSERPEVAMLGDSLGTIVGLGSGQTTVQAIAPNGAAAAITVHVSLAEIAVEPAGFVFAPEDADSLRVTVPQQGGRRLAGTGLQWLSSDPSIVSVSADGGLRALKAGQAEILVRGFLQERRVPVVVHQRVSHFLVAPRLAEPVRLPANTTREFTVLPQTADSLPVDGVPVTWAVGDSSIASFDQRERRLTARRSGTTTLSFAARGFMPKSWTIEVLPGAIAFDRSRLVLRQGDRMALAPKYVDEAGRPVAPATGLTWTSSAATVVRVSPDGALEALAPGRATISAVPAGGRPAELQVFVTGDLLVASSRAGKFGLYTISAAEPGTLLPILADSFANYVGGVYSPDRTRLAFVSDRFGNYDIFVADADGRGAVRITADPGVDFQPVWAPDGQSLVFTSGRGGTRQLYSVAPDGRDLRQLTTLPGGAEEPAISPDGRTIAFTGYPEGRDGHGDIYEMPLAGGAVRPVTATRERNESHPAYLPGGELVWLERRTDRKDPDQVLRMPASGGLPLPILSLTQAIAEYALAADGTRIAWVTAGRGNEVTLQWRSLGTGAETRVPLTPGERIASPAF